jgi:hypothetical protein
VPVFPVSVYPIIYVAESGVIRNDQSVTYEKMTSSTLGPEIFQSRLIPWEQFIEAGDNNWSALLKSDTTNLTRKINSGSILLKEIAIVSGAATVSEAYLYKEFLVEKDEKEEEYLKFVNTGTIDRYSILWGIKPTTYIKSKYQNPIVIKSSWSRLSENRLQQSKSPKIIIGGMTTSLECIYDPGRILAGKSTTIVLSNSINLLFLLGILNSRLLTYYYRLIYSGLSLQGGFYRIGPPQIRELPIRLIENRDPRHDRMVALVERMLALHKQSPRTPQEQELLRREIEATDQAIDRLVYELYGLTEEEIKVVEGG